MSTKVEKPLEASQLTHVADMPPLEVVTAGIPEREHLELPPSAPPAPPVARERRGRMWAWALAGVMGLLLVVAGVFAFTRFSSTGDPDLTAIPPVGSDVGGMVPESVYSGPLEGPALPYIPYLSIPSIPSIAEISIPSIPSISPMPAMSMPAIAAISVPSMSMSIPRIAEISFPAIPSMPAIPSTEPTEPISFPTIEPISSISIPSIPSISFPSFPEIPSISIPPIAPFPSISFPDM